MFSGPAAAMLTRPVAAYIRAHRDRLAPGGVLLTPKEKAWLTGYFATADLERVRIVERDPLPVATPPFSDTVRSLGFDFPDLSLVSAITFDHVIATREPMPPTTLFHELVHVVQFRLLGVGPFARLYTRGMLSTRSYEAIPLEQCAYQLEDRFASGEREFLVEAEVAAWKKQNRF